MVEVSPIYVSDEKLARDVERASHLRLQAESPFMLIAGYPLDLRDARSEIARLRSALATAEERGKREGFVAALKAAAQELIDYAAGKAAYAQDIRSNWCGSDLDEEDRQANREDARNQETYGRAFKSAASIVAALTPESSDAK